MTQPKPERDADWYWQDGLAKFFPTSKGPTGTEKEMFRYGFEEAVRMLTQADTIAEPIKHD